MGESGDDNPLLLLIGDAKPGEGLTKKQKAALWQCCNKTWKPHKNPYDRQVGEAIYAFLNDDDEKTEGAAGKTASSFEEELMRQLMASMK